MNGNNGTRPLIYQGALNTPYPSPKSPKFASYDRLPPAQTHRHTWAELCGYVGRFFLRAGVGFLTIELVVQILLHGYFKVPTAGTHVPGLMTHYLTLEIGTLANQEEITKAWQEKERSLHPDVVGNTEESREAYYWIQLAYVELSDPLSRCYHDQYHGFIPRKFGRADPCTAILMERARDAKTKDEAHGRADEEEALSWVKSRPSDDSENYLRSFLKTLENSRRKETAEERKQELFEKYGDLVEQLEDVVDWIDPWPYIVLGLSFGLIRLLIEYTGELAFKYEWRRRLFGFMFLS